MIEAVNIDLSKAQWVRAKQGSSLFAPVQVLRIGALFILDGTLKEVLATSPHLYYVGLEEDDELTMIFSSYDAAFMKPLEMVTGPTYVMVKIENKDRHIPPWEQGFQILSTMFFRQLDGKEIGIRMKVRAGKPV